MKPGGIICSQGETFWNMLPLITDMCKNLAKIFPVVEYGNVSTPTYPNGHIGYFICSKDETNDVKQVKREPKDMKLSFYSTQLHAASFVLPKFVQEALLN